MGVGIVIDMRGSESPHEKIAVEELGMRYVSIPWHCPFPSDATFARFLRVIHENPHTKIFVHCRLGDDRTGMAIATYRMAEEGWSADEALKEMKEFGFRGIHHLICPTLEHYEKEFPQHLKSNPIFREPQPKNRPRIRTDLHGARPFVLIRAKPPKSVAIEVDFMLRLVLSAARSR